MMYNFVFPAYAGVIPSEDVLLQCSDRFSRIRGGDPDFVPLEMNGRTVFPAYAGVILGKLLELANL